MNTNELKTKINQIIFHLIAIDNINKDIHYTAHGESFYSKHIFVEKFNFGEDIDLIKESILLGNSIRPLSSIEYLIGAINLLKPVNENDDRINFEYLKEILINTYKLINETNIDNICNTILTDIGVKILQYIGLINLQLE